MEKSGGDALGQREPQVLEVNPHGPGGELGLLGRGDKVDGKLLALLKLITQPNLHQIRLQTMICDF